MMRRRDFAISLLSAQVKKNGNTLYYSRVFVKSSPTQLTCQSSNEAENANLFCKAITILHEK